MYDCIIPIGCSHMYGYEHASTNNDKNPSNKTWVDYIGRHLSLPVFNCSVTGASNQTIYRRLHLAIEYCKKRNLNPIFILQWTAYIRYETIAECTYFKTRDWPYIRPWVEKQMYASKDLEVYNWSDAFYKLFDDAGLFYETTRVIEHCNLLAQEYKVINCISHGWDQLPTFKSQFVKGDQTNQIVFEVLDDIYKELGYEIDKKMLKYGVHAYIAKDTNANLHLMWKNIESYDWWHWDIPYKVGMNTWCKNNKLEIGPRGHAMESANKIASEYAINNTNFLDLIK